MNLSLSSSNFQPTPTPKFQLQKNKQSKRNYSVVCSLPVPKVLTYPSSRCIAIKPAPARTPTTKRALEHSTRDSPSRKLSFCYTTLFRSQPVPAASPSGNPRMDEL
ncbi:uncharacterized protein EAF02_007576 [Botrytis sinoallii]|uniref:uncharacterized protein n=1 Tax=Botrytis sinoallii TaxID=1463999 RepID=UPI0019025A50|nr:uncharacterized protein EAF02_007576 [Botrytis sinoallii]KAF7879939.1 hypothetical protein EAF02_007576 [Botrytis sinoallii]